jgi:hypothetical protein
MGAGSGRDLALDPFTSDVLCGGMTQNDDRIAPTAPSKRRQILLVDDNEDARMLHNVEAEQHAIPVISGSAVAAFLRACVLLQRSCTMRYALADRMRR